MSDKNPPSLPQLDWKQIARQYLISRKIDDLEEQEMVPAGDMIYQFSARGHCLSQTILAYFLTHPHDAVGTYYRSRPLLLALGFPLEEALAASLARMGGYSDGRDVGVTCNFSSPHHPTVLPMAGDVGGQYTPIIGWAQAVKYRRTVLKESQYDSAIAVAHGGDGSVASNGFWSALTIATTLELPILFYIEDNDYGISVPSTFQTPEGNISRNLHSFRNLTLYDVDGTEPDEIARYLSRAVKLLRDSFEPVLLRLHVPRLAGHSIQDTQKYKSESIIRDERRRDPLPHLKQFLLANHMSEPDWDALVYDADELVHRSLTAAKTRPHPDPTSVTRHIFFEPDAAGSTTGGISRLDAVTRSLSSHTDTSGKDTTMLLAIRRTLDTELARLPELLIFGEDVGAKGGVHGVTQGLQEKYGTERVFDTSLSEEGIVGRAVGMAMQGLKPVAEIQFRKYADPATEQMNNCGTIRWRTANRFAAPIVLRMPGGFAKCGDPWHSMCNEVFWAHATGWRVAMPSNAADAVGLLRSAIYSQDPCIFFEHRALLNSSWAKRPYPGDDYIVPFGKARDVTSGDDLTIVSWGALLERCENVVRRSNVSAHLLDLRTIAPWDSSAVLTSVRRTGRLLVVHEDTRTAGFGAEIVSCVTEEAFVSLKTAPQRLAVPDIPLPYNTHLLDAVLPTEASILVAIQTLLKNSD